MGKAGIAPQFGGEVNFYRARIPRRHKLLICGCPLLRLRRMKLLSPLLASKLPTPLSPGNAITEDPPKQNRLRRICGSVFILISLIVFPAQAELPEPGRYVGTFGDSGRISYVINRSQTRIHSIKCSFIARDVYYTPYGVTPEYFQMEFSSGKRDFLIFDSNSFGFHIDRNDPKTRTFYIFAIRQKRRGLHRGFFTAQQRITYQVVNQSSGVLETIDTLREPPGTIYFETRLRR